MSAPSPEDLIRESSERWRTTQGLEETTLLGLALLRDLHHRLHAAKSSALGHGRKDEARSLKEWEIKVESLREKSPLTGELSQLLEGSVPARKRSHYLPEALFGVMDREKLERFDRLWEAAIAAEACLQGWRFWRLTAWVEISQAEDWHRQLGERLWPSGISLFTESTTERADIGPTEPGADRAGPALWQGSWTIVLHPRLREPAELRLDLDRMTGTSVVPTPPRWRLLFSPKKR